MNILRWETLAAGKGFYADTPREHKPKPGRWLIRRSMENRKLWVLNFNGENVGEDTEVEKLKAIAQESTTWWSPADFTTTNLEAAILDQKVAGAFTGKRYAFVSVPDNDLWILGVAVNDEPGYSPIRGKTFDTKAEADSWAAGLNKHIGLSNRDVAEIIASSMRHPVRL